MWMRNVKSYSETIPLIQGSVGLGTVTHSVISEPGGRGWVQSQPCYTKLENTTNYMKPVSSNQKDPVVVHNTIKN